MQIQHSLCIKVTANHSGSISIIQCFVLSGRLRVIGGSMLNKNWFLWIHASQFQWLENRWRNYWWLLNKIWHLLWYEYMAGEPQRHMSSGHTHMTEPETVMITMSSIWCIHLLFKNKALQTLSNSKLEFFLSRDGHRTHFKKQNKKREHSFFKTLAFDLDRVCELQTEAAEAGGFRRAFLPRSFDAPGVVAAMSSPS